MLQEFVIRNFVIIEDQSIQFGPGLNVISGETGTGKSVLVQALQLLLGGRAQSRFLRKGADGWEIEALFDLSGLTPAQRESLPDEVSEADELLVSRSSSASGKGRVLLNGRLSTVSLLREITPKLLGICSQHEHVSFLDPKSQTRLLDQFSGDGSVIDDYRSCYDRWRQASLELEERKERREKNLLRQAELEFVLGELGKVSLTPKRRDELEEAIALQQESETLLTLAEEVRGALNDDGGAFSSVSRLSSAVRALSRRSSRFDELASLVSEVDDQLQQVEQKLEGAMRSVELNEEELEEARAELSLIAQYERRFHTDCAGLAALQEEAQTELDSISDAASLEALQQEVQLRFGEVETAGARLRKVREKAARKFEKIIQQELADLNLADARLQVTLTPAPPGPLGTECVEFLFEPNRGEGARPLKDTASGGELSRLTLVMKKVLRDRHELCVLVFDEVDTGVSGSVASAVGAKLKSLSSRSQCICVTHLAQVASFADQHFTIEKRTGKRTVSVIRELDKEQRVEEIARMLAGYDITPAARASAKELISSQ